MRGLLRFALMIALWPRTAQAAPLDLALTVQPSVAGPLGAPQSERFGVGGGALLAARISVHRLVAVEAIGGFLGFSSSVGDAPTLGTAGAGIRVERARDSRKLSPWYRRLCPWGSASALYVRTGPLDRFGFTAGAGVAYPVGRAWLGVFARYLHVVQQPEIANADNTDAKIMMGGVSVDVDFTVGRVPPPAPIDPRLDSDKDGVKDIADKCPHLAGPKDNAGCPYADADSDGVVDNSDKCPKVAGPAANAGCPDTDGDADGVVDREDQCPTVAGAATAAGCPDRDADTVADADDVCPDRAGVVENHGCPRYLRVQVTEDKLELSQKIFFSYDGDVVLDNSFPLLDEVAEALRDHPLLKVRIEGHTDGQGTKDHNMKLSVRRAEAVREYLVRKGVARERLDAHGYGPTQRLQSDATPEGRERNRRVEFVIVHERKPEQVQ
jgi:outer membrane protein OmpA-like peptidoglycan-associated protein